MKSPDKGKIIIYNLEFVKTQDYILNEPKFKSFIKQYFNKGFEIISKSIIESNNPNDKIINTYSIRVNHPYYDLVIKDSNDKSVF